jgi:hypothetical protein
MDGGWYYRSINNNSLLFPFLLLRNDRLCATEFISAAVRVEDGEGRV